MNWEQVPDHWESKKLSEIGEIYSGGTPDRDNPNYFGGDIPWLRLKDAKQFYVSTSDEKITQEGLENSSAQLLPEGSVIVSTRATIGEVTIAKRQVTTNQGFKAVYPQKADSEFVAYFLSSITDELENLGRTTTYPEVNKTQFSNIEIPLPSISEQRAIVKKLNSIFEKLNESNETQSHAEDIARKVLNSAIKRLIDSAYKSSEQVKVEDVCDKIKNGGTPKRSNESYWGGNIPWLKSGELKNSILYDSEEYMTEKGLSESSAKMFSPDTVLVAMYGATRGETGFIKKEMSTNQAVCGLSADESLCEPKYLWYCLRTLQSKLASQGRGGGQDNINQTTIRNTIIPLPSIQRQRKIIERIELVEERANEIRDASNRIGEILDILPKAVFNKAFSGNL
ncbi:restriction endonuclease subunit S [Halomarina ordinaria]|uniref:Restriction endonuclease subunit S n=1 Tax=Halomarina ordinaria TaxID=3033939 RepID=A0ABD5U9L4_9EURY|nr:restriction endonuclease subunit S [Halomarina sp. PSRA2]